MLKTAANRRHSAARIWLLWYLFIFTLFSLLAVIGRVAGWKEVPAWYSNVVLFPIPLVAWLYRLVAFRSGWSPPGWFRGASIAAAVLVQASFVWLIAYGFAGLLARELRRDAPGQRPEAVEGWVEMGERLIRISLFAEGLFLMIVALWLVGAEAIPLWIKRGWHGSVPHSLWFGTICGAMSLVCLRWSANLRHKERLRVPA